MNFKKLTMIVNGIEYILFDKNGFQNFNILHKYCKEKYEIINDILMEGIVDGNKKWEIDVNKYHMIFIYE